MPTPIRWSVPTELSAAETAVARQLHRIGKFYVFLRTIRSALFDEAFQAELAAVYRPRGTQPVPPALLATALLLQAYDQVGDAEAVVSAALANHVRDDRDRRAALGLGLLNRLLLSARRPA